MIERTRGRKELAEGGGGVEARIAERWEEKEGEDDEWFARQSRRSDFAFVPKSSVKRFHQ